MWRAVNYVRYFKGNLKTHLVGVLGGVVWESVPPPAILLQERPVQPFRTDWDKATLVAALWGVFIWKEFKNASKSTNRLLVWMFLLFILGIVSIIYAGQ